MTTPPRLDLVVGCNGAGKSSLITDVLQPDLPRSLVVNADVIAKQLWPGDPEGNSYAAARIAADRRAAALADRTPLIAETVFSHASKLDLIDEAHRAGFTVVVHAVMIPVELAVHRVATRVESGGHDVPDDKIRSRYERLWPNVATAIRLADRARVYDNASTHHRVVADFVGGVAPIPPTWPAWTPLPLVHLTEPGPQPTVP